MNRQPKFIEHPVYKNYLCCEDGRIFSRLSNKFLSPKPQKNGYYRISIGPSGKQKSITFHRFLMVAFKGMSALHVNHKDGIKTNNSIDNLEYVTHKENIKHAVKNKLIKYRSGQHSHMATHTEEQMLTAITFLNSGRTTKEIERMGYMTYGTIQGVVSGKSWKHLGKYIEYPLHPNEDKQAQE